MNQPIESIAKIAEFFQVITEKSIIAESINPTTSLSVFSFFANFFASFLIKVKVRFL